ncbi:mucin-5B-like [Branchiostoma floridae]|uniref:Mucin-5B-like n=1 Tax=Branchiostoma floridae TaxID=7739 RepID=A0A9J7LW56_BRAFL|nr:mucin-5B-like [Branchiostoma floridae]
MTGFQLSSLIAILLAIPGFGPPTTTAQTTEAPVTCSAAVHFCEDPEYLATRIPGLCIRKLNCNGCAAQYHVARATCEAEGASLLTRINEEQFVLLQEEDYYNLQGSWIGLDDIAVEGTYVWNDGSPLGSFRPFHPTVLNDEATDCVIVGRNVGSVWAPYDCNNKVRYICQKPSTCPNVTTTQTTIANSTTEVTSTPPLTTTKTTEALTTKVAPDKTTIVSRKRLQTLLSRQHPLLRHLLAVANDTTVIPTSVETTTVLLTTLETTVTGDTTIPPTTPRTTVLPSTVVTTDPPTTIQTTTPLTTVVTTVPPTTVETTVPPTTTETTLLTTVKTTTPPTTVVTTVPPTTVITTVPPTTIETTAPPTTVVTTVPPTTTNANPTTVIGGTKRQNKEGG